MEALLFVYNQPVILSPASTCPPQQSLLRAALLFSAALLILISSGCAKHNLPDAERRWKMEDLRVLEAPEEGLAPESDLVAAYTRRTGADLEMRFDLLGSPDRYGYTLTILLDTQNGGSRQTPWGAPSDIAWDLGLSFPPMGMGHAFTSDGTPSQTRPRIIRLEIQDAAVVRLNSGGMENIRFQTYLIPAGASLPTDAIGPVSEASPAVTARAPLLLAFTDTLPSATPAQALRRWDGAHTGPFGQRHGLKVLLDAASKNDIPLALLDLKQADQLPVLEALGELETVREIAKEHQLLLPEIACGDPEADARCLEMNRQAAGLYGLPETGFLFRGSEQMAAQAKFKAIFTQEIQEACDNGGILQIPMHTEGEQVNEQGLENPVRKELLRSALSAGTPRVAFLGGSLPSSPWGDSLIAGPSMEYIAGHPWIEAIPMDRLPARLRVTHLPGCPTAPQSPQSSPRKVALLKELSGLPDGVFARQAWQTYIRLTEPVEDARLQALRGEYLGIVKLLITAARWEASPVPHAECGGDFDGDGAVDCILSSPTSLAIIQARGGRVAIAAARVGSQVMQVIGPRSQRVVGLSDPLDWQMGQGYASDPQEISGAFGDPPEEWADYRAEASSESVTLTRPDGTTRKIFSLLPEGFRASIETTRTSSSSSIPLIFLDEKSGEPGWLSRYHGNSDPAAGSINWEMQSGPAVHVSIHGATSTFTSFADALSILRNPEDPNAEMLPGAFLPFPMALAEIQYGGSYQVEIVVSKND